MTSTHTIELQPNPFASALLESGATGYAGYASARLLEEMGDAAEPFRDWRSHLTQRLLELSAAVGAGEERIFIERVRWSRQAALARQQPDDSHRRALECLRSVLRDELPAPALPAVQQILDHAIELFDRPAIEIESSLDPQRPNDRLALQYLERVLEGDSRGGVELLLDAADFGTSVPDIYLEILVPAQREIGRLWHRGELGISEEHLITATTLRAMAVLLQRADTPTQVGKTVVAAAVAGNLHDLAIRAVSDFFELRGWHAVGLGGDVPANEIATAAVYFDADLVVLSATLVTHLKPVEQSIVAIRKLRGDATKIQVGGQALEATPDLWRKLGADGFARTAEEAVILGASLVGLESAGG
ncbi:MAG: cobalamin-dependent protein [Acidobacteriota bacterium]